MLKPHWRILNRICAKRVAHSFCLWNSLTYIILWNHLQSWLLFPLKRLMMQSTHTTHTIQGWIWILPNYSNIQRTCEYQPANDFTSQPNHQQRNNFVSIQNRVKNSRNVKKTREKVSKHFTFNFWHEVFLFSLWRVFIVLELKIINRENCFQATTK